MPLLLVVLMSSASTSANWLKDICARYLVAETPYPYADHDSSKLIEMYELTGDAEMQKELNFRLRAGMLEIDQMERVRAWGIE